MEDKQPLAAWSPSGKMDKANGTKSLHPKKPSWSHCWELLREGLGAKRLPLHRSQLCPWNTKERNFPPFLPSPALGSNEILVPKSQSAHSSTAALGWSISHKINPKPWLRKNWNLLGTKHFWSGGNSHGQGTPRISGALNPSWLCGSDRGWAPGLLYLY